MGFLKCPRSSWASELDAHPLVFFCWAFIALVHPLHGNPYSLTSISIDGHLHSPLIRLVDVRLPPSFCLLHNHHCIPPIVLCPWLTLMYCVKVEKSLRLLKYETIAWLKPGLCLMGVFCVMKMKHILTIWFCRDKLSLAMLFWEDMIALISLLEVLLFLCQYELLFWIIWIWTFMPQ